jgi:Holliday junction DNA helicase RuvA
MIGRLRGLLVYKRAPALMLDVHGVGYELEAPLSVFYDLPGVGDEVSLFTHLAVREDAHVLYGFASEGDKTLFRTLLKISGVGAKMALAILSGMSAADFSRCVQMEDTASLVRLPGIGKKTAQRLVVEMKDRMDGLEGMIQPVARAIPGAGTPVATTRSAASEAIDALIALGYRPADATRMIKAVESPDVSSEELIRAALKAAV